MIVQPTGCHYLNRLTMLPPDLTRLLDLNWYLFPVSRVTKKTPFRGAKDNASSDRRQIEEWYREYPGCNWRVHPGKSRVFCLDIDRAGNLHECDGFTTMRDLVARHGQLPRGPRLKTGGSGGVVAFFRHDGQELRGGAGALGPGIDVSTIRGAACPTVPPSVHQISGGRYLWYPNSAPWEIRLPPIPEWICEKLKPPPEPELNPVEITDEYAARLLGYYADDIRNAPSGASNRTLYACAFKAGRLVSAGKISYSDAVQALRIAAQARVKPEKRGGIMPTIKSGLNSGMRVS